MAATLAYDQSAGVFFNPQNQTPYTYDQVASQFGSGYLVIQGVVDARNQVSGGSTNTNNVQNNPNNVTNTNTPINVNQGTNPNNSVTQAFNLNSVTEFMDGDILGIGVKNKYLVIGLILGGWYFKDKSR